MKTPIDSISNEKTFTRTNKARSTEKKKDFGKSTKGGISKKQKVVRLSRKKYQQKVVQIKRVTKVVKGGKKMTFRAVVIIGDEKQKVGVGIGRAEDVSLAIEKAILHGKKHLMRVPITLRNVSVPHVIKASYGACQIMLRPASAGTGVIAGGSVRTVLELGGIQNILAKQFGSNNILNNAKATILALKKMNETIELRRSQSMQKQLFYNQIMKKYKNVQLATK